MTATTVNPWDEQDLLNKAVEQGAVFTHARTGWKFKLRLITGWSPYLRRATALVLSRQEVAEIAKKKAADIKLTPEEEALDNEASMEIFARAAVMGWGGVTDRAGKKLELNTANAKLVFGHMKQLYADADAFCSNPANYGIKDHVEAKIPDGVDAEGNSSATSNTASEASPA